MHNDRRACGNSDEFANASSLRTSVTPKKNAVQLVKIHDSNLRRLSATNHGTCDENVVLVILFQQSLEAHPLFVVMYHGLEYNSRVRVNESRNISRISGYHQQRKR